ncbi:DUF2911 domain-containing protein [Lewinella sp. W8]|uniref:DUF2911 domain-containing protein n=1 Tax=Lewinella sp. W8 TaxID=2528208 RepID=UPI001067D4D0|nr:DUF2911 domain-containing protein [Lewinella sp. W8]MTB49998.1 DUF2911 domain-containing protein [Lewinella sp. W8]
MKTNSFLCLLLLALLALCDLQAQAVEFGGLDASPMDAAHYPRRAAYQNYLDADDPDRTQKIKVLYSRPNKKDRDVFGGLEPYGQDWRLGANEATEVTFFQAVEIGNVTIPAGVYTMFAQIYPQHWVIKISEQRFIAGAANRDVAKDIVAVTVPTEMVGKVREAFTIGFQEINDNNVNMVFEWDRTRAELPINLSPPQMAGADASPMDLIAYPPMSRLMNFVEEDEMEANAPQVRVVYSRPQMNGREIFGGLLKFGEVWRLGANETTIITFFKDVTIGGKDIRAGNYGLFAKVNEDNWEFILHRNVQSWGNANHDDKDNIVTVKAPTAKAPKTLEALSMTFVKTGDNTVDLAVGWEDTMARLPITVKK